VLFNAKHAVTIGVAIPTCVIAKNLDAPHRGDNAHTNMDYFFGYMKPTFGVMVYTAIGVVSSVGFKNMIRPEWS
jgi:hypothetical protein